MYFDYEQIELRLLAFYMSSMGDHSMAQAIKNGKDLHVESATAALRLPGDITDEQRQVGKVLNFSMVYGGGRPTIVRQLGVNWNEAGTLLNNFHAKWPGIRLVQEAIRKRIEERAYITTLWGRHLHPESDHKALNALVQGCAADLLRAALVKVHDDLTEKQMLSHLVNNVHDEIQIDAVADEVPYLQENIPVLMDDPAVSLVVPIGVDLEWSTTTWAEKEAYCSTKTHSLS